MSAHLPATLPATSVSVVWPGTGLCRRTGRRPASNL